MDPTLEPEVERVRPGPSPEAVPEPAARDVYSALGQTASGIGNRNFTQMVARLQGGEGILAGGLVHPDVEAAIAASRGRGRPLERQLAGQLEQGMGEPFGDVRVHTGDQAAALARAVDARAFTVGSDIFFADGEYSPGSRAGAELISHEVAHVVQQRGAPLSGPLTVSQPGDPMEREAEAVARDIAG